MKDPTLSKSLEEIKAERKSRKLFRQTKREIKAARGARLKVSITWKRMTSIALD